MTRCFQIKKLSTIKFQILEFKYSNIVLHDEMTSNQKLPTIEFHNFSRFTIFILIICFSDIVVVTLFINLTYLIYLSCSFINTTREMKDL